MSRHPEQRVYQQDAQVADIRDEDSSHGSEREVSTVVLNLERFHDCLDSRRADVIQYAASLCEVAHVPAIAALKAGDQTIRIPFPDVLAATEDVDNSPMVPGIQSNGVIQLDPDDHLRRTRAVGGRI
jgi:hypothetical protein